MSHVPPGPPRKSGKTATEPPFRCAANRLTRPVWAEIAVVGLALMFAAVAGGFVFVRQLELGPLLYGLILRG